jgi:hypothetical protein
MEGRFVAYYCVSTDKPGDRDYGLEAQRKAVLDYLNGGEWKLVSDFTEVESGMRAEPVGVEMLLSTWTPRTAEMQ